MTTHDEITGVVPDQTRKLLYLIKTRGDQRPRNPRNPTRVVDDGTNQFSDLSFVTNQTELAEALGVAAPIVNRWIAASGKHQPQPIEFKLRDKICVIYKVLRHAFDTMPFDDFVKSMSMANANWHKLVAEAPLRGRVLDEPPTINFMYADVVEKDDRDQTAQVVVDKPFWVQFESPKDGSSNFLWSGWQVLLFNHDREQSGFKCYLPRYRSHSAFGVSTFPSASGMLALPSKPVLVHHATDIGKAFEMVLVACQDPLPAELIMALSRDAHGPAIEPELQELAKWIDHPLKQGTAAVVRAAYRVVNALN